MKHMTNPMTRTRYNTLRRMPYIKAPTLVLWGDKDETNDVAMGRETAAKIPGAKLVVFENTGHMLPQQQPDRFNKEVLAFLAG
jgi:pimeloyl-ACP methyl ester carboxylesterase